MQSSPVPGSSKLVSTPIKRHLTPVSAWHQSVWGEAAPDACYKQTNKLTMLLSGINHSPQHDPGQLGITDTAVLTVSKQFTEDLDP